MGGKPSKQTPKDQRLKRNKQSAGKAKPLPAPTPRKKG